jgi:NAD(P)H dehydrogenase (quinone)
VKVLVLHAHPVETSFNRSLYNTAVETLTAGGHTVDALNLYDDNFTAVMSREERLRYHDVPGNLTPEIKPYVDRLLGADAIVVVFPVWNYGFPAILKGFFDRIFVPGVSFVLVDGKVRPNLTNIRKAVFITHYGGDRFRTMLMGDPPRRIARRWAWVTFSLPLPPKYLALYKMDRRTEPERKAFIERVRRELRKW